MHITGGWARARNRRVWPQYELPNNTLSTKRVPPSATCSSTTACSLLHKDAKYLDVAEAALLNNVLAAVNLEGNRFFYVNPLESDGKYPFNHGTAARAPWFGTACCPSNLARLLPQVPGMTYASDGSDLVRDFLCCQSHASRA